MAGARKKGKHAMLIAQRPTLTEEVVSDNRSRFVIARETAGQRPTPPWMEVIASQMRVLVHSLPARQVIDTPVQEQLIVELYSK